MQSDTRLVVFLLDTDKRRVKNKRLKFLLESDSTYTRGGIKGTLPHVLHLYNYKTLDLTMYNCMYVYVYSE